MLVKPPLEVAKAVIKSLADLEMPSRKDVMMTIRKTIKDTNYAFPTSIQLWEAYRELLQEGLVKNDAIERALRVKDVRTDSGVAPITVLTKPYPCPGNCVYCPTEYRMPKSYISSEPAAARALSLEFDPYEQVRQRVQALERNGHTANKIELIVKGGTWSAYPKDYREWFIARCFEATNELTPPNLPLSENGQTNSPSMTREGSGVGLAQSANQTAAYRIIGLTIETRPDHITAEEVIHLRQLGVTRVELGLQIINDRVLKLTGRGTTVADAANAIALLKAAAFKVDVHILPGQPGASLKDDLDSFKLLFDDPHFRPDMIKLYPCVVLPNSELYEWTKRGDFKPLEGKELRELLIEMQTMIPYYCRVSRLIRDFPTADIAEGNKQTNLRESIESEMKKRGLSCKCLRCREVGHVPGDHTHDKTKIFEEYYENAGGTEVFLSVENEDRTAVFGFCRLRLPDAPPLDLRGGWEELYDQFPILKTSAQIRELHTYGTALNINEQDASASQHKGYGRKLMARAEEIAKSKGYKNMAVISGIGVRGYYQTLGYHLEDTYMIKALKNSA